jgi:zinc protease
MRAAALILALWPLAATASPEPTLFKLDNGMEIVVLEDHRAPVVVHMVWYRAGAADEAPGQSGVAHFLEHLMFKGTDTMASGELSETVSKNGGSDNAFTSWDQTVYFQRVAADRLELMMQMEADRMRHLKLTEEDVATEREVILEERSQRTDSDPGALFMEQMSAALYLNHPYGRPIIGWRHEMEALDREDALAWYKTYYAPNNAVLIVAGDVDPAQVKALAETYYGPLEPTPGLDNLDRQRAAEPPQIAERRVLFEDPRVSQSQITRSYLAPERDPGAQEEAAALTILANILGGNSATSVLGTELMFGDAAPTVYAGAGYGGTSLDDTSFDIVIIPKPEVSLADAEAALDRVLTDFLTNGIDDARFERIKMQLRADDIYADDDMNNAARRYGSALMAGLSHDDIKAWPDILQAVTEDDVMAAARAVLDKRRSVTGWLIPPTAAGATP